MSVIVRNKNDYSLHAFVKGSPERINELCLANSLPKNFDDILS